MGDIKSEPSERVADIEEVQDIIFDQNHQFVKGEPSLNFTTVRVPPPSPSNTTTTCSTWVVQSPSYANSPAGCSSNSSTKGSPGSGGQKRGRGRPRKEIRTKFDNRDYEGLSPAERKYKMLRDKNNEASRKSRLHKTQKTATASLKLEQFQRQKVKLEAILARVNLLQAKAMAHLTVKC